MILPHHRGPCVHPQFTTKTSLGIPRTPKPRVQFLLFFCLDSPSVHPRHKKTTKKPSEKSGPRGKRTITTSIHEKILQVLLDMLNVQVLASPVLGFGPKRSTQMDFEAPGVLVDGVAGWMEGAALRRHSNELYKTVS